MLTLLAAKIPPGATRRSLQWAVAPIAVMTLALGWKYPLLGFFVPVAMLTGVAGGFVRGRWVCGHLCPRGAFFDRMIAPFAPRRPIPPLLRRLGFRWTVLVALMGFMVWRLAANPADPMHWGRVFWSMCALTTGVGLITAFGIHPRSWCSFCPIGTLQNVAGGGKRQLRISAGCRECGRCERACTMALPIRQHKNVGVMAERDCVRCGECIAACPINALSWPPS